VQKYGGTGALLVYLAALAVFALLVAPRVPAVVGRATERQAAVVAAVGFVVLAALFVVLYPHLNRHGIVGSDRDDAADLGARALLHGHYPYDQRTYLDQSISQLPGALLLAAPFVALGHSAYAGLLWLPVLLLVLRSVSGRLTHGLAVLVLALVLSPALLRELLTGGDLIANGVAVLLAALLVLRAEGRAAAVASGAFLGLVLSTRLNFVFAAAPLVEALRARRGRRRAAVVIAVAAVTWHAVTVPFVLHSGRFAPFEASNQLQRFNDAVPGGETLVGVLLVAAVVAAALAEGAWSEQRFLVHAALGQLALVLSVACFDSVRDRSLDFSSLIPGYGLLPLFFGLAAARLGRWRVPA
jgi:hypothetical protein